jgi:hypothetical protein
MSVRSGNRSPGMVGGLVNWWHNLRAARMRLGELHSSGTKRQRAASRQ